MQKNETGSLSYTIDTNQLKMDWRLECKTESITLLEENIGGNFFDIGLGGEFLELTPKAKAIKSRINKWDFSKLKSFCTTKKPSTE